MARSLSWQKGCSIPFHLFVFYNAGEDARLVLEGLSEGPRPPTVTMIHVPAERVLQKALHFSQAHTMHSFSHTVFVDADLWFPPEFWAEYVSALSGESPGYWSCRVMNIPLPGAEGFINDWKGISQCQLGGATEGRRYDRYSGHVGHFQCVPRDLMAYPPDPRPSVDTVDLLFSEAAIALSSNRRVERRIGRIGAYHMDHPPSWNGTNGVQH